MRIQEAPFTTCQAVAAALLPVIASRLYDVPYVVSSQTSNMCSVGEERKEILP